MFLSQMKLGSRSILLQKEQILHCFIFPIVVISGD